MSASTTALRDIIDICLFESYNEILYAVRNLKGMLDHTTDLSVVEAAHEYEWKI